jgi:hypothetical protein
MGASFFSYLISWVVFFLLNGIILSGIFIAVLYFGGVFSNLSPDEILKMLGLYFLLLFAIFSFCLMLSSFFSNA